MEIRFLPVEEVGVWFPQAIQYVDADRKYGEVSGSGELKPCVDPALPEVAVHLVGLDRTGWKQWLESLAKYVLDKQVKRWSYMRYIDVQL